MPSDKSASVTPALVVEDATAALAFYADAFSAEPPSLLLTGPGGAIVHAAFTVFETKLTLADASMAGASPKALGATPLRLTVDVEDIDGAWAQAVAAGCEVVFALTDQPYGMRQGRLRDPFGHEWIFSKEVEALSAAEMQARIDAMFTGG